MKASILVICRDETDPRRVRISGTDADHLALFLALLKEILARPERDQPSNRTCWRAPPERCRNADEKKPPGCFSSVQKGGGVEQARTRTRAVREILHWRTRPNFLAKFFGKKFWK